MQVRRKTTFEEQTSKCEGCGFPFCERHHMLEFSLHGENMSDIMICPNCHWLLHVAVSSLVKFKKPAYKKWNHMLKTLGDNHPQILWAKTKMQETLNMKLHEQVGRHIEEMEV